MITKRCGTASGRPGPSLAETVQALAAKADVKARIKGSATQMTDRLRGQAAQTTGLVRAQAGERVGEVRSSLVRGRSGGPPQSGAVGRRCARRGGAGGRDRGHGATWETAMSMAIGKAAYKPVGLLLGMGAGVLAGALFRQVWKMTAGDGEAPDATDEDRGWGRSWPPRRCRGPSSRWSARPSTGAARSAYAGSPAVGRSDRYGRSHRLLDSSPAIALGIGRDPSRHRL